MKLFPKNLLVLSFLILAQFTLNAQTTVGLRAGINVTNISISGNTNDSKIGIDFGLLTEIAISEAFSIQPELHYSQKGDQTKNAFVGGTNKVTLNYLQIPILAKYVFGGEEMGAYAIAGPSIGLGLGVKSKNGSNSNSASFKDSNLKGLDFGLDFGLGLFKAIDAGKLFLDIRYLLGLSNIGKNGADLKNRGFSFGAGFMAPIGG